MTAVIEDSDMPIHEAHPTIRRRDVVKAILLSDPSLHENSLVLLSCKLLESSGFMADVFCVTFCRKNCDGNQEEKTIIIKAPTLRRVQAVNKDANFDVTRQVLYEMHVAECGFYERVAPKLRLAGTIRLARCYLSRMCTSSAQIDGWLAIDDIATDATKNPFTVPHFEGLSSEQVEASIRAIATFHARTLELPHTLIEQFSLRAPVHIRENELFLVAGLCRLPDTRYFADHKAELLQYLSEHGDLASDEHKLFGLRPVLCHGDYWNSNIFFHRINDITSGSNEAVDAIIDFQCTKAGTGVGDLLRLIFVGVEPELRHRRFYEWLHMYFDCFRNAVIENRIDGNVNDGTYEIQQMSELIRAVRHHRTHETCFALFLFKNSIFTLSEADQRRRTLIRRAVALFEDAMNWEDAGKNDGLDMDS